MDRDDYEFQAPVRKGQKTNCSPKDLAGSCSRGPLHGDESDIDLDIYVAEKILAGGRRRGGSDIKGLSGCRLSMVSGTRWLTEQWRRSRFVRAVCGSLSPYLDAVLRDRAGKVPSTQTGRMRKVRNPRR